MKDVFDELHQLVNRCNAIALEAAFTTDARKRRVLLRKLDKLQRRGPKLVGRVFGERGPYDKESNT